MAEKNTHGGRREGSGRKTIGQKPMALKLDNDLLPYVQIQPNKNRFINDCIRKTIEAAEQYQKKPDNGSE